MYVSTLIDVASWHVISIFNAVEGIMMIPSRRIVVIGAVSCVSFQANNQIRKDRPINSEILTMIKISRRSLI